MKAKDSKLEREGWYTQVGYFMPKLQGVFKYEEFEDADNKEEKDIKVGLNYFIKQNRFKLQINYVHRNETKEIGTMIKYSRLYKLLSNFYVDFKTVV